MPWTDGERPSRGARRTGGQARDGAGPLPPFCGAARLSEDLLQTDGHALGRYRYYRLGASTLRQLKSAGIVRASIPDHLSAKKPDGLIVLHGGATKAVIEYKPAAEIKTPKQIQVAIQQELAVAAALCKLLIVTSGSRSIWVNALNGERVRQADGTEVTFVIDAKAIADGDFSSQELEGLLDAAEASLTATNNTIAAPDVLDPSKLAGTIWQKIWVQTGKSPEKCLYNVVELFIFKFLSDLGVLKEHHNFWSVERLAVQGDAGDALKHYANTCRREVQELFPPGPDGTTIINGTIFVNEGGEPNLAQAVLFAEIVKELANYDREVGSFRYIRREFKTRLYESFLRQSAGVKALGQYFTPRNVVQAMVQMARQLNPGARICDPFCGVGGFLLELLMEDTKLFRQFVPNAGRISPQVTLIGYDKGTDEQEDERTIILAKANMLIYFSDILAEHHSPEDLRAFAENGLNAVFRLLRSNLGTFAETTDEPYDLILTNPPYVTKGSRSLQDTIAQDQRTARFYDFGLKGTEGLALNWIIKKLRPGGEAFVIVPDGLLRRQSAIAALREHCLIRAIVSLPSRTFYATPRSTYILALEKKTDAQEQTEPVFGYVVKETGETRDAKRFEVDSNDLVEMVSLFRQFRGDPSAFRCASALCKVVPFDEIRARDDWRADRWWTYAERVELGLSVAPAVVGERAFVDEMAELAGDLRGLVQRYPTDGEEKRGYSFRPLLLGDSAAISYVTTRTGWKDEDLQKLVVDGDVEAVPVYRAAAEAFGSVLPIHKNLIEASAGAPLISFAANGDGSAGTNFIFHEQPFYVTGDRTVLRVEDENIDPRYVMYALRNMKAVYGFDHTHKAVPKNLTKVSLDVPVTGHGEWDIDAQREIVQRHQAVAQMQDLLRSASESVTAYDVAIA